jgi:hypothetical protein
VDPGGRSRQHVSSTVSVPGRYTWNEAVSRCKHAQQAQQGNKENDKVRLRSEQKFSVENSASV